MDTHTTCVTGIGRNLAAAEKAAVLDFVAANGANCTVTRTSLVTQKRVPPRRRIETRVYTAPNCPAQTNVSFQEDLTAPEERWDTEATVEISYRT